MFISSLRAGTCDLFKKPRLISDESFLNKSRRWSGWHRVGSHSRSCLFVLLQLLNSILAQLCISLAYCLPFRDFQILSGREAFEFMHLPDCEVCCTPLSLLPCICHGRFMSFQVGFLFERGSAQAPAFTGSGRTGRLR